MSRSNLLYACVCAVALTSNQAQAAEKPESASLERKRLVLQRHYSKNIERAILRNFFLPAGAESVSECKAIITLAFPNEVVAVEVEPCGPNLVKAIEKAIFSASIPQPLVRDLFETQVEIMFAF
jgi:hypothetical protein